MQNNVKRPAKTLKLYNPVHFLASGFGTGFLPFAPGTWGTLIAIPLYYFMRNLPLPYYGAIVVLAFGIGVWICEAAMQYLEVYDHKSIVWDEIVGYWITMIAMPQHWIWMLAGFLLFRFFDILKPWPINWVDKEIRNGFGIMFDDVLAAVYAAIVLRIIIILIALYFKYAIVISA